MGESERETTRHAFCMSDRGIYLKQESIKSTLKGEKPESWGNFMSRNLT